MENVVVLMSTYNGGQYLNEQLDSIFCQMDVNVALCVRDDGSDDNTLQILYDYKNKFQHNIDIIEGHNIGWKKSFLFLINYASKHYLSYKYFAFSDQDDIWLPKKLSSAINSISTLPAGYNVYISNLYYYKGGVNYGLVRQNYVKMSIKRCLVRNVATGCSMMFNDRMLRLLSNGLPQISVAHDYWIYQVGLLCGNVFYDDKSYILYRQHENNEVGVRSSWKDIWKRRLRNISNIFTSHHIEVQATELWKIYKDEMGDEAKMAVSKIVGYRKSLISRLRLLLDNDYTFDHISNDAWMKLKIIFGIL